jgi:hypothetical protein
MRDTGPIRVEITADISRLESGMRRAAEAVEEWASTTAEAGTTASSAFGDQERLVVALQKRIVALETETASLTRRLEEMGARGGRATQEATKKLEEYLKVQAAGLEGQRRVAAMGFEAQAAEIQGRGARGEISKVDELTQLRDLHQAEIAEEMRFLAEKLELDAAGEKSAEKLAQDRAKQDELIAKAAQLLMKDEQAILTAQQAQYERSFQAITRSFNTALNGWLQGTQSFGRAMTRMWDSIALAAVENILKIAEQGVIALALHKTMAGQQILTDAKTAASGAYAAVSQIPIVGPILAPAAAAAAFAGVMAFDTFEYGGVVPRTGVAMVHAGERVLPPSVNTVFERMAAQGAGGGLSAPMTIAIHGATDPGAVGRMVALQTSARIRRTAKDLGYRI